MENRAHSRSIASPDILTTMIKRVALDIPDLHCDGCIASVSQVLETFSGISEIVGDLEKLTLTVEYDLTTITPQAMKAQLAAIGYPVAGARDL